MRRRILLVTGSRDLHPSRGGSLQSERWAKALLTQAVFAADPPYILAHGGAQGPDAWAAEIAAGPGSVTRPFCFALDGWIYDDCGEQYKRWRVADGPESNPLRRNDAMIERVVAARAKGWHVEGIALYAPWSRTHGAGYTVRIAKDARIRVTEHTCPEEMRGERSAAGKSRE